MGPQEQRLFQAVKELLSSPFKERIPSSGLRKPETKLSVGKQELGKQAARVPAGGGEIVH